MTSHVQIDDCVDRCKTWNPAKEDVSGRITYIDLSSVDKESKQIATPVTIPCANAPSRARQLVAAGDILVSTVRPNLNGVAMVPPELDGATASTGYTVLRPRPEIIHGPYLFQWVKSPLFVNEMVRLATGASYPAVSDTIVRGSLIPLPPLPKQRHIAALLDKTDALRAKRREAIAKLDQLLRSVFLDMFGDPVTNPRGWPTATVAELASFITSGSRGWAAHYSTSGALFIRIQNLVSGELDLEDCAFVDPPDTAETRRTLVQPGDVLVSITADLGRTAVVPKGIGRAHINQHIAILRLAGANPAFVSHFLASAGGQHQFKRLNRAAVKAGLNFNDLRSLKILMPPDVLQGKYLALTAKIKAVHANMGSHLKKSASQFTALQQQAFAGGRNK